MSEELRGWSSSETIALGITNPGSCVVISGDPEFLKTLVTILEKEHPEWTDEDEQNESDRNIISIALDQKNFDIFRLEHPEIFNNQNKKLKFKYIANEKETK
jgi:malonyl CoA-acyl carrier protein transacylase